MLSYRLNIRTSDEIYIRRLVGTLQHWYVPTDLQMYNNSNGQELPARRRSAKFAMRYGDHDRYGRSGTCRCYVQQPSSNDCRMAAIQPKCQREDHFKVIGVGIVSVRQANTSLCLGFPHNTAFVKRFDRRPNHRNKHPEQFRQLYLCYPNSIAANRHR